MYIRCLQTHLGNFSKFVKTCEGMLPPQCWWGEPPQPWALLESCPRSTSACTSPYSGEARDQGLYSTHKILQGVFFGGRYLTPPHHMEDIFISQSNKPFKVQIQPFCNLGKTTFVLYPMEGLLLWAFPHTKRDLCPQNGIPINREIHTGSTTNVQKSNF